MDVKIGGSLVGGCLVGGCRVGERRGTLAGVHDVNTAVSRMGLVPSSGIKQCLVDGLTICYFRLRFPMAN